MRVLLVASSRRSMKQREHVELAGREHEVSVELALCDQVLRGGVARCDPDLVIAPMLTTAIPGDIWPAVPCFVVHPGPAGDRGPSSLDWAIMGGQARWGVTVLQANAEMDAGDIWASAQFALPAGESKSSVYRTEVADAAAQAVLNPHYQLMGLHGSEYWTYTLPRRVGPDQAARLTTACLPVSPAALRSGLVDQVPPGDPASFRARVNALAGQLAASPGHPAALAAKAAQLAAAEHHKPLAAYRAAELAVMRANFTGPAEPYARLRRAFVHKAKPAHTPAHLARHRTRPWPARPGQSPAPTPSALARQPGPRDGRFAAGRAGGREEQGAQAATPVPAATAAGC